MPNCDLLGKCIFFNDKMANMPSTANIIKLKYCNEDNTGCARYMVYKALGREMVPSDLFPNQVDRARELIAQG